MSQQNAKRPQVALESTLVAFGMPAPQNVEVAWKLAASVTSTGAEPKTLAVIDGQIKVGLHDNELERLTKREGVLKLAASDIGPAMAMGLTGATTVSATCALAYGASIRVFATGGIGGVHRDAVDTFDESQDLTALSRFPVAVVCSGAKAILDLPRTLERLETLGVPVLGFGTNEFPAFYTRSSGMPISYRIDDVEQLARVCLAHWRIHPGVGVLICNPIPESHEMDPQVIDAAIERALAEAKEKGIRGKALTPWLLSTLNAFTEGKSVVSNIALAESNARLAGELACAIAELSAR